jgi:hypothetical protein
VSGKLHLPPAPPSEGVHRLACWMLGVKSVPQAMARIDEMRRELGEVTLDRIVSGELLPGLEHGAKLAALTGGRVQARQFRRPTGRRWGDAPAWDARRPETIMLESR